MGAPLKQIAYIIGKRSNNIMADKFYITAIEETHIAFQ